ncbi:hypothetical protein [uncultured Cohaesibacter sp.]|uniref:hypothetical protein n=1 Tax=uncultured Cohaesibacter sp. TaxID=1002546 RepID=UPI002931B3CF|nr:hypothetical protein [uncultured Cohaesibacter sp.]
MDRLVSCLLGGVLLIGSSSISFADFDGDVDKAYAAYRVALFKSNQKDEEATKKAIAKFQSVWTGTILSNYTSAPAKYAGEKNWTATLEKIGAIADEAANVTMQGKILEAHEVLEEIRDQLDGLRDRNGVRVFSNFVNAYHTEMEHVMGTEITADNWNDALRGDLREKLGILTYLAKDLAAHAPEALRENEEFGSLLKGLEGSIDQLRNALEANDPEAVKKAVGGLKPAYAKLFVKFG